MSVAVVQSGSQTCTINTEHTLTTTIDTAGTYVLKLDLNALVSGDVLEVRIKSKCRAADTQRLGYYAVYANAQTELLKHSIPIPIAASESLDVSIKQTAGTGRAVPWNVLSL